MKIRQLLHMVQEVFMVKTRVRMKRYSLLMPEPMYNEVRRLAQGHQTTVAKRVRDYVRLGATVDRMTQNGDAEFIVRKNGKETILHF
jgi:hypothetical protein